MGLFSAVKSLVNGKKKREEVAFGLITIAIANDGKYSTKDVYYEALEKFAVENGGKSVNNSSSYVGLRDGLKVVFSRGYNDEVDIEVKEENNERETRNYVDELADYILERSWTRDREQAVALADTFIINMGFIEAKEYVTKSSNRYYDTYNDIWDMLQVKEKDFDSIEIDANFIVAQLIKNNLHEIMNTYSEEINDIAKLIFRWEAVRDIFIERIKEAYPTGITEEMMDELSNKLMDFLCFSIMANNSD